MAAMPTISATDSVRDALINSMPSAARSEGSVAPSVQPDSSRADTSAMSEGALPVMPGLRRFSRMRPNNTAE